MKQTGRIKLAPTRVLRLLLFCVPIAQCHLLRDACPRMEKQLLTGERDWGGGAVVVATLAREGFLEEVGLGD